MRQVRSGSKVITAAGVRERLAAASQVASWLRFYSDAESACDVMVGGDNVTAAGQIPGTKAGVTVKKGALRGLFIPGPMDLHDVWLDVQTNGDGVHFTYELGGNAMGILASGSKVVTTAGAPQRIVADDTYADWLLIQADDANTGDAVVGDRTVVAATGGATGNRRGIYLKEGGGIPVELRGRLNLKDVWVDVENNGDAVHFTYLKV